MLYSIMVLLMVSLLCKTVLTSPVIQLSRETTISGAGLDLWKRSQQVWVDEFDNVQVIESGGQTELKSSWSKASGSAYFSSLRRQLTAGNNSAKKAHIGNTLMLSQVGVGFDRAYCQGFLNGLLGVGFLALAAALFYVASRSLVPSSLARGASRQSNGHRRGNSRWSTEGRFTLSLPVSQNLSGTSTVKV